MPGSARGDGMDGKSIEQAKKSELLQVRISAELLEAARAQAPPPDHNVSALVRSALRDRLDADRAPGGQS